MLDQYEVPIKVMEKAGDSIQKLLVKSNPFKDKNCNDPKCRAGDIVYEKYCEQCSTCQGRYDGETADPIKELFSEHLEDYRLRTQNSSMYAHSMEKHNGEKVNLTVKLIGVFPGDALLRQCIEEIVIRDTKPKMNSREEWGTKNNSKQLRTKQPQALKQKETNCDVK